MRYSNNSARGLLALLLIGSLLITACTSGNGATGKTSGAGSAGPTEQAGQHVVDIAVTANKFSFDPDPIRVKKGDRVRLHITSLDVAHGFMLPDFGINEPINPGETTNVEFVADKAGTFTFRCSVFCGSGHQQMTGTLIVEEN